MTGSLASGFEDAQQMHYRADWGISATYTPREGGGTFALTVVPGAEENDYQRNDQLKFIKERKREADFEAVASEIEAGLDGLGISRTGANGNQPGQGDTLTITTATDAQRAGVWTVVKTTPQSGGGVTLQCVEHTAYAEDGGGIGG